jgi:hypothetical protein
MPRRPPARHRLRRPALLAAVALLCAAAALGQGPAAEWRTLATAHFRLHYPAPYEAWAQRAAVWLELVRQRDIAEIGFTPADTVDVVISDPRADANGEAFPLRGWPRLVLWTSPAPPESELGAYRDSIEDLAVHEEAHLVHLLRPSRNALLASLLPVGSIALGPRWLVEGYATLVEGRLTGSGRPNGDLRAAILRRWAEAGRLPSYSALSADNRGWHGMSMAYLLGSAYLEWLEQRAGPGSLKKLWARMTAKSARGFDEAFSGIWGNSPPSLYDRFRAELTWRAMEAEKRVQAVGPLAVREGPLWQEMAWSTGAPAVSPDGSQIALVRRSRERPAELVIWSTAPDTAAEKRWQEEQARLLARDPQDVPAVRTKPLPRQPLITWTPRDGGDPAMPRFMPDGRSLLLVRFMPDEEGFIHPDLFEWRPAAAGAVRRITRQADLRDPDPAPDGAWAVAVRNRFGLSQLVTVDLAAGAVRPLTAPSLDRVYDRPRLSPDGRRVAFAVHEGGTWKLAVMDLGPGRTAGVETDFAAPAPVPAPGDVASSSSSSPGEAASASAASSPAWSPDGGSVYAVVGRGGFLDLYAFAVPPAGVAASLPPPRALTRTQGAALAPAPTPDGKAVFYLSLEPYGLDLHRLDLTAASRPLAEVAAPPELAPAVRPPPPLAPPPVPAAAPNAPSPPAGSPYGAGRQELLPLLGGHADSAGGSLELGVRSGDLIGRLDLLALGAVGSPGAPRGGTLAGAWRGGAVEWEAQVFDVREDPSRQAARIGVGAAAPAPNTPATVATVATPPVSPVPEASQALDLERRGAAAGMSWSRQGAGQRLDLGLSLLWQRLLPDNADLAAAAAGGGADTASEGVAAAAGTYRASRRFGLWRLGASLGGRLAAGRTGADTWSRFGGEAGLSLAHEDVRLTVGWRRDGSHGVTQVFDLYQLGGSPTSLLPAAALAERIVSPALPVAALLGAEVEAERVELAPGFLPLPFFWERYRLWGGAGGGGGGSGAGGGGSVESAGGAGSGVRPAEMTLGGFEYRLALAPFPLVRLPAVELRLGAARLFSGQDLPGGPAMTERPAAKDRNRFWLLSVWRP